MAMICICALKRSGLAGDGERLSAISGIRIRSKAFDLAVKEQARQFGNWVLEEKIVPDVLVNNAGQFFFPAPPLFIMNAAA